MTNKLTYFIARSSMFGIGFFLIFQNAGKDAWISILLGTLLGLIILYIYNKIKQQLNNNSLEDNLKNTFLGKIYIIILILFYLYLMIITLMLLPLFVNSFYLTTTPKILVNIPFLILAIYITFKGKSNIENLSKLLCIFSLIIILFFAISLTGYLDFNNLIPVFTNGTNNIIECALIYASLTSIPQIITINYSNDFKNTIKDYLLSSLTIFTIIFFTVIAMGEPLLKIYSFPEYTVLRQIKILNFIENIENISAFIWYFDLFIMLATLTNNLKNALPKKYNLIYFYLLIFIILIVSSLLIGGNYVYIINIVYIYPISLFIFFIIFLSLLIYLKYKNKTSVKN
ncbi:MAG: hypothetical protein E7161_02010 [Firmicutes bacterium]|nr:hypothetical protein [Bacillota bacterium]